jgi:hypothetical protein
MAKKTNEKNREHGIYKYVYDGEVIYIGKTDAENGFQKRINAHKNEHELFNKSEIYVHKCKDNTETDSLETILINAYKPILNKMKLYDYEIEPPKLNWIPWNIYSNKNKIVSLKDALSQLEYTNLFHTNSGRPVIIDDIIPCMTDRFDLVTFHDDGDIRVDGCMSFPTKTALLKMKNQIENMLINYDVFLEQFRQEQIDRLRKALNKKGYVLDIDTNADTSN